jgi:hypothetical protein
VSPLATARRSSDDGLFDREQEAAVISEEHDTENLLSRFIAFVLARMSGY